MSINVNRSVSDQFYRYKMPRLVAKVEGKGNGIKTVIVNMVDVAKALNRPPTYPTKFFGCELGAQTQFDTKNDRYIVNGSHEANKLQDMLDGFIHKFVLCPECDNPETDLFPKPISQWQEGLVIMGLLTQKLKFCHLGLMSFQTHKTFIQRAHACIFYIFCPQFCHNNKKAQKYLLGGFECLVKLHQTQLLPRVPIILKDLYDADLLEEDVILAWAEKVSKKYVSKELAKEIHAKAEPFVKWLKEAEEESEGSEEEEDDEDDNVEVVYSSSARELKMETTKPEKSAHEEEDIDIDAI
ncbi:eukaryotic translation initiation factor 5-like [Sinocyclocheilus grahami]|uniref:eukaryotic translation initiation factor 5-like n=1 Tax=Sinocyclocheilus grahami TaxID=75366 RepID=UPI0007AD07AF|nr:PREDICTED: eukaryotic translation initiation factor 5-like [Sinocyclocheilus grahami]